MKITMISAILFLLFIDISAEKTIICEVFGAGEPTCDFLKVTVSPKDKQVTIKPDLEDYDAKKITIVRFKRSSIHSIPREVSTKFPNVKWFDATQQNIQEIKADTFWDAKNLEAIDLSRNSLSFLHRDTFKGEYFHCHFSGR
jgi:hypothetical protein